MKIKQPSEAIELLVSFGVPLASLTSTTLLARALVPDGAPIVLLDSALSGSNVAVEIGGGADGERYLITVKAVATSGALLEREVELAVVDFTWAVPSFSSPYLSPQGFVERAGLDTAIRLTDESGTGSIDVPRLANALADATATAESFLAALYAMPISPAPADLVAIIYDLALARLWQGRADLPDSVAQARDVALRSLREYADRRRTLPNALLIEPAAVSAAPVLFEAPARSFTRDKLAGF